MHAELCLAQQLCNDVPVLSLVVIFFLLRALLPTLHQVDGKVWWDPSDGIHQRIIHRFSLVGKSATGGCGLGERVHGCGFSFLSSSVVRGPCGHAQRKRPAQPGASLA